MLRRVVLSFLCALAILTTGAATTGCAAAVAWWQGVLSNPGSAISFVNYVITFLQGVVSIWNAIFPTVPSASQNNARINFDNAVYAVEQSLAALEEAIQSAAAAHQDNPDFSSLVASVKSAVTQLMKFVQSQQGPESSNVASTADASNIARQARVIASWK